MDNGGYDVFVVHNSIGNCLIVLNSVFCGQRQVFLIHQDVGFGFVAKSAEVRHAAVALRGGHDVGHDGYFLRDSNARQSWSGQEVCLSMNCEQVPWVL